MPLIVLMIIGLTVGTIVFVILTVMVGAGSLLIGPPEASKLLEFRNIYITSMCSAVMLGMFMLGWHIKKAN